MEIDQTPALEKVYEPQRFEPHWAKWWVESGIFHADARPGEPYFSLVIPPPNVTGSLHIGHMFEHSIIDAQVRWQRMLGVNTLWLPGTDHAGISTQIMVERQIAEEGLTKHDLGREKFWSARLGMERGVRRAHPRTDEARRRQRAIGRDARSRSIPGFRAPCAKPSSGCTKRA